MKLGLTSVTCKYLLAFVLIGLTVIISPRSQAQTFSIIHSFSGGGDGGNPLSGFTIDAAGNLYGTTSVGGASGAGTVFKMNAKGREIVLHSFGGGTDGANPAASLLLDAASNLYGTTTQGGPSGAGTVFKVGPNGKENVLYSFAGATDGANPEAGLTMDATGKLYGTTAAGGSSGNGTVFELVKKGQAWSETVLYSFGSGTDGATPVAGVTLDAKHNLYGTTSVGGTYGYGTIFQLAHTTSGWIEHILYNFQNGNDGGTPYAGLIVDRKGNFYGATTSGGTGAGGTIFKVTRTKSGWNFAVIYSLPGYPLSGPFRNLMLDASGNLYGTTHCDGANSAGTAYKLTHSGGTWTYTSLHEFTGGTDGNFLFSGLVLDKHGNLYGTTQLGGADYAGEVFKIKP